MQPYKNALGVAETIAHTVTIGSQWHVATTLTFPTSHYTTTGTFGTFDTAQTCTFKEWDISGFDVADMTMAAAYVSSANAVTTKQITWAANIPSNWRGTYNMYLTPYSMQSNSMAGTGYRQTIALTIANPCTLQPAVTLPTETALPSSYTYQVGGAKQHIQWVGFTILPTVCQPTLAADYNGSWARTLPAALTTAQSALTPQPVIITSSTVLTTTNKYFSIETSDDQFIGTY